MTQTSRSRKSKKRQQIITTAEILFSRYGAKRVTVEEICREAGASKMTFYKYFPNKTALVKYIKRSWTEEGFKKFDEIKAMNIPFNQKIQLMTRWKTEFAAKISSEFIRDLVGIEEEIEQIKRRYLQNISEAQIEGDIRPDIAPEFLWMVINKLNELVKEEKWKGVCRDFADFQYQLRVLLYHGLLTRLAARGGNDT
jgi:AcrR family transcriptional regulator